MRNVTRSIGLVLGSLMVLSAGTLFAQDWPQWRGANRDGKVSEFSAPQSWPKTLTEKWQKTLGAGGDATPALVGDKLYVFVREGSDEVTLCLNANDGSEVWKDQYKAKPVTGAPTMGQHTGPRSSPTVADGKVVTLGATGVLSCLEAATGKVVWRTDEIKGWPQFYTAMSPLVVNGLCVAQLGGPNKGAVVAFDLATGKEKWRWDGDSPAYSSPVPMTVEGTKQIVCQTKGNLVGLAETDGKLLWKIPTPTGGRRGFYNSSTPIVDGSTVFYTGQGSGTKAVKIEKEGDGFAVKELWSSEIGSGYNTPVLKNGFLFGSSAQGAYCLNAKTGEVSWSGAGPRDGYGGMVDAGSVLVDLTSKGQLYVFKPESKQYEELAKIKVASAPTTYATPVLSGKRIFVKDQKTLTLYTVE